MYIKQGWTAHRNAFEIVPSSVYNLLHQRFSAEILHELKHIEQHMDHESVWHLMEITKKAIDLLAEALTRSRR